MAPTPDQIAQAIAAVEAEPPTAQLGVVIQSTGRHVMVEAPVDLSLVEQVELAGWVLLVMGGQLAKLRAQMAPAIEVARVMPQDPIHD